MDTKGFDEKNLAKHKERCDMIEQLAIAEEENRKLGIRADKLEQRLESETRKAERRMRHIDLMGAALTERRSQLHERGERIAELEKQVADLRAELANVKQPTEREREILDMWPRFEDGEFVWFGDAVEVHHGGAIIADAIEFTRGEVCVKDAADGDWNTSMYAMRPLKRPAPEVLDADGVEIKVGDTVYEPRMYGDNSFTVSRFTKNRDGRTLVMVEEMGSGVFPETVTHTRPGSWERLEEDACKGVCEYAGAYRKHGTIDSHECDTCRFYNEGDGPSCEMQMARDIICRAKALAGEEVE